MRSRASAYPVWRSANSRSSCCRSAASGRRPLAADKAQMERLFALRQAAYSQAHRRIAADAVQPEEIAEQIVDQIAKL